MNKYPAGERFHTKINWLDSWHSFSFGEYYDENRQGFRSLRVINDDVVAPKMGFGRHPHRNMEIITYVVSGSLRHEDSTGGAGLLGSGMVQRMSAGKGIAHSEFNASQTKPLRLLQIWILPDKNGHQPSYEDKSFPIRERQGELILIASPDGAENSTVIHQDVRVYAARLRAKDEVTFKLNAGRHAWIQVVSGAITVNDAALAQGDGASTSTAGDLRIRASTEGELLLFDLA